MVRQLRVNSGTGRVCGIMGCLLVLLAGCGKPPAGPGNERSAEKTSKWKPTLESFRTWAEALVARPRSDVLLDKPERWFAEHFEPRVARRLTQEYAELASQIEQLPEVIRQQKASGKTQIEVWAVSDPKDPKATGAQAAALKAMRKPVTLYTLRMKKPGERLGFTVWSFVYQDGQFRLAGKMRAASRG